MPRAFSTTSSMDATKMHSIHRLPTILLVLGALLVACGDSPTAPADVPENHTVVKDGVFHAPGLNSPEGTCSVCHGADLMGGANGQPSCFSCHGKKWG